MANNRYLNASFILMDQDMIREINSALTIFIRSVLKNLRRRNRELFILQQRSMLDLLNSNFISNVNDIGKISTKYILICARLLM